MSLEAYTGNLSDLVITNPTPTDPKSQGDSHLRGIKKTLVDTFGATTGPIYGPSGVKFPDGSVQGSAAYSKAESDAKTNQAWQDVTGTRAFDTDFVNNTGRTITLAFTIGATAGLPVGVVVIINGLQVANVLVISQAGSTNQTVVVPIPNNATYRVTNVQGTAHQWLEFR